MDQTELWPPEPPVERHWPERVYANIVCVRCGGRYGVPADSMCARCLDCGKIGERLA